MAVVIALINVLGYNGLVSGGNKTLCNHKRRLLLLSHYMYTQSIKMVMMRMIVTVMVENGPTFGFHFQRSEG